MSIRGEILKGSIFMLGVLVLLACPSMALAQSQSYGIVDRTLGYSADYANFVTGPATISIPPEDIPYITRVVIQAKDRKPGWITLYDGPAFTTIKVKYAGVPLQLELFWRGVLPNGHGCIAWEGPSVISTPVPCKSGEPRPPSQQGTIGQPGQMTRALLTKGWDIFNEPLSSGAVQWKVTGAGSSPNNFQVDFQLFGASPNHEYSVGVTLFNSSNLKSKPVFSQFGSYACYDGGVQTREAKTAYVVSCDLGQIITDSRGDGRGQFNLSVRPGTYYMQYIVRVGGAGTCVPSKGIYQGCAVVYRTGGRFADNFETVVISR